MLLKNYRKNIFRAEYYPSFESLHCIAHLEEDVSEVLPYLNAVLGGFTYIKDPPSVTFKIHGKLLTVQGDQIAVNALRDEAEADKILEWIKREINEIWDRRATIEPSYESAPRPNLIEIFKMLPRTNCQACGLPTCMVFAAQAVEGVKSSEDCPPLALEKREQLQAYLSLFVFDF